MNPSLKELIDVASHLVKKVESSWGLKIWIKVSDMNYFPL